MMFLFVDVLMCLFLVAPSAVFVFDRSSVAGPAHLLRPTADLLRSAAHLLRSAAVLCPFPERGPVRWRWRVPALPAETA